MPKKYHTLMRHYICHDCGRSWWLDSAEYDTYRAGKPSGSVDCPYCSMRALVVSYIDSADISGMLVQLPAGANADRSSSGRRFVVPGDSSLQVAQRIGRLEFCRVHSPISVAR